MTLKEKLLKIQTELKAPKNLHNSFGNYNYRNAESIYEAVKPLLIETKTYLLMQDEIVNHGDRYYIKATATLVDTESDDTIEAVAFAREPLEKKGQDQSQITGSTSSFARKYALNGLFILDDTKDEDSDELRNEKEKKSQQSKPVKNGMTEAQKEIISKSTAGWNDDTKKELLAEFKKKFNEFTEEDANKFIARINEMNKIFEVKEDNNGE